jgi:hypothetical protein
MSIVDSGERRKFESGAVRDIAEGKGRCDLLPLDVIASMYSVGGKDYSPLTFISIYIYTGEETYLYRAIFNFCRTEGVDGISMLLEVSKHYEEGAKKYAERNWEKGIPLHCYIDSGVRHYLKHMRGDTDERHDRAFVWNMLCAVWTQQNKPSFIDLPFAQEGNNDVSET